MTTKHTPGPWCINHNEKRGIGSSGWNFVTATPNAARPGEWVADCGVNSGHETAEANARLIAAAPDLLAACEAAVELVATARNHYPKSIRNRDRFSLENTNAAILAAVAKARGTA